MAANPSYFLIKASLQEDVVWRSHAQPALAGLPENVETIWHYAFTEMFNNAIDHSDGTVIWTTVERGPDRTTIVIGDDGEGIFRRIRRILRLCDPREAIFELAKGKLTTDPDNHTGEGIFFTSRMLDRFAILSRGLVFLHDDEAGEDWLLDATRQHGTSVIMELANDSKRTAVEVFDEFTSDDGEFGFDKTVIPLRLATEDGTYLISRSQARRIVARIERFNRVVLDFRNVKQLGQGFADQIFRIFARDHPNVALDIVNANDDVIKMVRRARAKANLRPDSVPP
jgi:anti-sigma regulatory factor (Ser/Thr protein kinase)